MTKENYAVLVKYQSSLRSAAEQQFFRNLSSIEIKELNDVYVDLGYKAEHSSCNACVMKLLVNLYRAKQAHEEAVKRPIAVIKVNKEIIKPELNKVDNGKSKSKTKGK